ncbi:MAG TPA: YfbK domain-containing protein [Polyangiaceae bacterium]|nr:YfbK domain-containing protein [Polyangiaceae bacterium]
MLTSVACGRSSDDATVLERPVHEHRGGSHGRLTNSVAESDADFRWAVAVAGVAELLKQSPYAPANHLETIHELLSDDAFADDPDKQEFIQLFQNVRAQLE